MPAVRELESGEEALAAAALAQLRPQVADVAAAAAAQRDEGYRLVASFEDGGREAAAVAGFRVSTSLHAGRHLYVDDLVTRAERRGRGHAGALMTWLIDEARRCGCGQLHLDSGVGPERMDAHRLYFNHGLRIASHHFARGL